MVSRTVLVALVFGLAVLIVAFAVLMAFHALVLALGDQTAGRVLFWTAITCLMLVVTDMVLLLAVLGLKALNDDRDESGQ